jgi:hypothetical protein
MIEYVIWQDIILNNGKIERQQTDMTSKNLDELITKIKELNKDEIKKGGRLRVWRYIKPGRNSIVFIEDGTEEK